MACMERAMSDESACCLDNLVNRHRDDLVPEMSSSMVGHSRIQTRFCHRHPAKVSNQTGHCFSLTRTSKTGALCLEAICRELRKHVQSYDCGIYRQPGASAHKLLCWTCVCYALASWQVA